jgi:hypothetical protein
MNRCNEIALIMSSYSNSWSIHAEINLVTWMLSLTRRAKSAPLFILNWSAESTADWCKRLGYKWQLSKLNRSWGFNDFSEHFWDSWLLSRVHFMSQLAAFTVYILNNKVTRDFFSESWSITLVLMLEHYIVMSWFLRSLKFDINLIRLTSSNTLDDLTPHRNFVATFDSWQRGALLNILLTCILEDVTLCCAFITDKSEVVFGSFGKKLYILSLSVSARQA